MLVFHANNEYLCYTLIIHIKHKKAMNALKETLKRVMTLAWQFVKENGYTMSEALKVAWMNVKLRKAMAERTVKFYFRKLDGSLREAYGTLRGISTKGTGRDILSAQAYFDTVKNGWRSFKKSNLISIA